MSTSPDPLPLLSAKTAQRMAELETALEISPGHGIAESLVSGVLESIMEGDAGMILSGWVFDDTEEAEATMKHLGGRWMAEDAAEAGKETA